MTTTNVTIGVGRRVGTGDYLPCDAWFTFAYRIETAWRALGDIVFLGFGLGV